MNRRLIIGLTLSAWCLYVASLFLPAFHPRGDRLFGMTGRDTLGWEVLSMCAWPFCWVAVFPFVYLIVNVVFFFSAGRIWHHLHGRKSTFYTVLASLSALASWIASGVVEVLLGGVGVGYFAWTAAITLVAVATCIPVNRVQSQVMQDSDGTDAASAV